MKSIAALTALLLALPVDFAQSISSREQTINYWNAVDSSEVGSKLPLFCDRSKSKRCIHVPVKGKVFQEKTIEEVVDGGPSRRNLQEIVQKVAAFPSPPDGSFIEASSMAIEFAVNNITSGTATFTFTQAGGGTGGKVAVDELVVNGVASVMLGGFDIGDWTWTVNGTTDSYTFTITEAPIETTTTTGSVTTNTLVNDSHWDLGGKIAQSSGRLYILVNGSNYVCSATAIKDNKTGRSLILTAAHCVWDDVYKVFASNVLFIPDRDQINTTLAGYIGRKCDADVCGCWTASAGVVLDKWTTVTWPKNIPSDFGFWIVDDLNAHTGNNCAATQALDAVVDPFKIDVGFDIAGVFTYSFGYSYNYDPQLRVSTKHVIQRKDRVYSEKSSNFTFTYCLRCPF